ncbi:hypothetical protein RAB80_016518 [Fusarium oxysporum f. sp. vasinfectum]|uniref:Uncharacterized protein n=1 Tax=Fusarium oxysporum f. sp. vasinfectum 25433 TaxID=1089449 RepID=X0L441_FUSOX|nr:hypothetical protein FOTG_11362 [Fusarium oxysporum f. sp. vasinfectum 25433]KAK2667327.1 hypothetical protein RAB80_016518 [Fusarium oxysporum f. sp. vasinfectum]KAK2931806.1 hypothetical protein FoTM2_009323 [Fusarium oxysporum f. sp. vasinfectum]
MPPQKSTPQKATQKSTPKTSTPQKSTQKSTTQKSTPQKSTTQKSTAQKSIPSPDVKGNWCHSVFKVLWSMVEGENGNTNTIKGDDNHVILFGNDNKNDLHGNKNLVAEHGANNENNSKGNSNKIGLEGIGNKHTPRESINNVIIYLSTWVKSNKGPTSGDQQTGNKGENDKANWPEQIRRMCERCLHEGNKWWPSSAAAS